MEIIKNDDLLALIAKKLAGDATLYETIQLNRWLQDSENNRQYFEDLSNIWDVSGSRFFADKIDTDKALNVVLQRIGRSPKSNKFWYFLQKIAAVLMLPLLMVSLITLYIGIKNKRISDSEVAYQEVHAAYGTRTSLLLADSTIVWLNSGSSLRYPDRFIEGERKVFLSGEAYFEVESDESKPFIVETPTLQVKATGTVFNVQEYKNDQISQVALLTGILSVNELDKGSGSAIITYLKPNQLLKYNKETKGKEISNEDGQLLVAWKDGKLIFRNEPLESVLNRLSMIFNVDIELKSDELKSYYYRATFQDESIEEILKLLKISAPLDYSEVKRNPLPDGSFPKKKVIIYPQNYLSPKL